MATPDSLAGVVRDDDGSFVRLAPDMGAARASANRFTAEVGREYRAVEFVPVTPSVRLARWLDADPSRTVEVIKTLEDRLGRRWICDLTPDGGPWPRVYAWGETRGEAITAALDQDEAATPEGGEDA